MVRRHKTRHDCGHALLALARGAKAFVPTAHAPPMPWKNWSSERLGLALAILAALGFSFKAIFVKLAYAVPQAVPLDSVTLLCLRMAFSVPVFAWVGWRASRNLAPLTGRDWLAIVALGLLGYYGASILDFIGLQYITASLERLILFTYPTLTIVIGVLFMGKRASRRELGALLLSYAGIGLAFAHDLHVAGDTHAVLVGAGFVFGSAVSYAFYQAGRQRACHPPHGRGALHGAGYAGLHRRHAAAFCGVATCGRAGTARTGLPACAGYGHILHRVAGVHDLCRHPPHWRLQDRTDRHAGAHPDDLFWRLVAGRAVDLVADGWCGAGARGGDADQQNQHTAGLHGVDGQDFYALQKVTTVR